MKLALVGIFGGALGFLLAHMGFGIGTWEFWAFMGCVVAYSGAVHLYLGS